MLAWGQTDPGGLPVRIRIEPETSRIEGTPILYRAGTPGAEAVARAFGFVGGSRSRRSRSVRVTT